MVQGRGGFVLIFVFHPHLKDFFQGLLPQTFFRGSKGRACLSSHKGKGVLMGTALRSARINFTIRSGSDSHHLHKYSLDDGPHPIQKEPGIYPCLSQYFLSGVLLTSVRQCSVPIQLLFLLVCLLACYCQLDISQRVTSEEEASIEEMASSDCL